MKTVEYLSKLYVIEGTVGVPDGAILLDTLSADKLVDLRNILTSGLDLGKSIKMFQSKAKGIKLVTDLLLKWDVKDFDDDLPEEMQAGATEPDGVQASPTPDDAQEAPKAQEAPERMISVDDLMAHEFEEEDLVIVKREWPDGIPATEASVKRAFDLGMDGGIFQKAIDTANVSKVQVRAGSKQAVMIDLLKRPEGASIKEIASLLEWQNHTVRGTISRDLKKRLGLQVTKSRVEGRGQVYRIAS